MTKYDPAVMGELVKDDVNLVFGTIDTYIVFKLTSNIYTSLSIAGTT